MDLKSTPLLSIAEIITAAGAGCSVCLLILLFVGVLLGGNLEKKLYRYFFALVLLMLTGSMSEFALPLLLRGPDKGGTLSIVVNFLNYAMGSLILAAFILYLYEYLSIRGTFSKKTLIIELCLSLANIPLMAGALLGQLSVMPQERSIALLYSTPWQSLVFPSLTLIIGATVTIRNAKKLRTREWVSLLTYMAIPMLCYGIEFAFKNVWITYLGSSIAVFLVYVNIQVELGRRVKAQELEIAESRVDIMLSQIQPHFVYNTLTTIEYLCNRDGAEQAGKVVRDFSKYLRKNLNSLNYKHPIPFTSELEHTKLYLSIEQLQYEERLQVQFIIGPTEFFLPALTLQPLVENAVKHGLSKQAGGGTIIVRTTEDTNCWRVIVTDDGVGFTPGKSTDDGREHIGIENVRRRLEGMCQGSLTVTSRPGAGTQIILSIPKGDTK